MRFLRGSKKDLRMSYYPEFARLVNDALIRRDRSPAWLAQRLGVNQSTVSRWLNQGVRPRDPVTVVRTADVLGLASKSQILLVAAGYAYQSAPAAGASDDQRGGRGTYQPPHNLPVQLTPFIGRHSELAHIANCLTSPDCRLLTIWGLGGIGKTRLALAAAEAQLDSPFFADGIYHVPLAPVSHPDQIVSALATALDLPSGQRQ